MYQDSLPSVLARPLICGIFCKAARVISQMRQALLFTFWFSLFTRDFRNEKNHTNLWNQSCMWLYLSARLHPMSLSKTAVMALYSTAAWRPWRVVKMTRKCRGAMCNALKSRQIQLLIPLCFLYLSLSIPLSGTSLKICLTARTP